MSGRELLQRLRDDGGGLLLLEDRVRTVGRIRHGLDGSFVERLWRATSLFRRELVVRDRQEPCRKLGTRLEACGASPNLQEHLADDVFSGALVAAQAQGEPIDLQAETAIDHTHRFTIAPGNPFDQRLIDEPVTCTAAPGPVESEPAHPCGQCDAVHAASPVVDPCHLTERWTSQGFPIRSNNMNGLYWISE